MKLSANIYFLTLLAVATFAISNNAGAQASPSTTSTGKAAKAGVAVKAKGSNPATSPNNPDVRSGAKEGVSETIGTPKPAGQTEFSTRPFVAPDSSKVIK